MNGKSNIYVVIDTNVLVSALFSPTGDSNPALVVKAALNGTIIPLYNDEIIEEYREVLSRKKFNFNPALICNLLSGFTLLGINTIRTMADGELFPDTDDIVFYEVALSVEDAYLVTGNGKHFPVKSFIVSPAQMIEILKEKKLL